MHIAHAPHDDRGAAARRSVGRVLIVEDDHLVAIELESSLLDAGLEVVGIAATAEEAVEFARADQPDLAIMDIRLASERDGVDAALDLFNDLGIRCIFATAHHDARTKLRAQPARPFAWLAKPYQPDALVRAINVALAELNKP
jgi:DNA-binding NarL/FixJ family response regulator